MSANPSFLDDFFSVDVRSLGVRIAKGAGLNFDGTISAVLDTNTGLVNLGVTGSPTLTDVTITGSLTVGGTITQGQLSEPVPFTATTTGSASTTLTTFALAANHAVGFELSVVGTCTAQPGLFSAATVPGTLFSAFSPAGLKGPAGNAAQYMGITPAVVASWSAGTITLTAYGPTATVTGCADNGGGKVRVTLATFHNLDPLDDTITGQSVTISGVTGCTEANGAHVATYVGTNAFDLLTVNFVNPYVSGGTVVHTTPPVISWVGYARILTPL